MNKNKKYLIIGITCAFLLISGFCYSCAFQGRSSSKGLTTSLSNGESSETQNEINQKEKKSELSISSEEQKTLPVSKEEGSVTGTPASQVQVSKETKFYVHICGAVVKPGVYQAEAGARICDLIKMADGLTKDAADDYVNQAKPVTDGERIYIPTRNEVEKLTAGEYMEGDQSSSIEKEQSGSEQTGETSGLIDINTATVEELMSLPGIGQAKADSIIEYRKANGKFQKVEDLMNISGIKEGLFSKISSCIIVK